MRVLAKTVATFLLFFLFASPSTAEIKSIKIQSDNRPIILFEKFGFTQTGSINITVSSVSVNSTLSQPDASLLGFFLLNEELMIEILHELEQNPYLCVLSSKFISVLLLTFQDLPPQPRSSFKKSYPVTYAGEYSLFFANCNPESLVTMDVRIEMFNTDDQDTNNYLSVGLTQLPSLYFIFSFIYLCFLGFWISLCFRNKRSIHQVHILMVVLLTMKAVSLFCAAEDKYYVKVIGTPHGWNILFYILQFINRLLLFTMIVLIGAGWAYLKPTLLKKEKKVLIIVITLQVLANVASIVIGVTGPFVKDWVTWNQVFLLADVVCCCAVVLPMVWSIKSFCKTDEKGARNLSLFRRFRVVVIGYLLVSRIGVFALKIIVAYEDLWICSAAEEITNILFYLVMFYMFRPVGESDYLVVDNECEYEEAPEMVKG